MNVGSPAIVATSASPLASMVSDAPPHFQEAELLAHVDLGNDDAALGQDHDQALARQLLQRFAHRRASEPEAGGEHAFRDHLSRRELQRGDLFLDSRVRLPDETFFFCDGPGGRGNGGGGFTAGSGHIDHSSHQRAPTTASFDSGCTSC
jgi:hypothetical protein